MRALRQADVVGALALIAEASALTSLEELPGQVLPRLRMLLRADIASFTHVRPDGGAPVWHWDPAPAGLPHLVEKYAAEHPVVGHFARTGDTRALRVSDLMGLREFQRLDMYEDAFRSIGAKYQLAAGLAVGGPIPSGVGFTRIRSDFAERERTLLDLLRPHLAAAYATVAARAEASRREAALERGLETDGRALAVCP